MNSVFHVEVPTLSLPVLTGTTLRHRIPSLHANFRCFHRSTRFPRIAADSVPPTSGVYSVGDFMTRKEELHVVKPTTPVDEALETLVEQRITGFPVIDDDWNLVGVVSDYDLLALDSISGPTRNDNSMFPEVDRTWQSLCQLDGVISENDFPSCVEVQIDPSQLVTYITFNEVQKLISKTNGKLIGELMTTTPMVVQETSNLEDAARILLQTKFRRLPVVNAGGKLVGIITRGNVVRAALQTKQASEN